MKVKKNNKSKILDKNGSYLITAFHPHPCQGTDAPNHYPVLGVADVIRIEDCVDTAP